MRNVFTFTASVLLAVISMSCNSVKMKMQLGAHRFYLKAPKGYTYSESGAKGEINHVLIYKDSSIFYLTMMLLEG